MAKFTVTKSFHTDTAHRLMAHGGKCKHLHGHRYVWEITIKLGVGGAVPQDGMIVDFGQIKETIGAWLDETFDHATVLQQGDPLAEAVLVADPATRLLIVPTPPTAENLALAVLEKANTMLAGALRCVRVVCWETPTSFATAEDTQ